MIYYLKALIFLSLLTVMTAMASAEEAQDFVAKLKIHYQKTLSINAFSLSHHYLNRQYRSHDYWDYQIPNRIMAQRTVEIDLVNKHFYDNDIYYTSGGLLLDRAHFENDTESFAYEMNGSYLGKRTINQGKGQFYRMGYILLDVDFLAVRPLLEETNIEDNITLRQDKKLGTTTLTHKTADDNVVAYEFSNAPLQLVSLNDKLKRAILTYEDYQTARGLTYARTVHQYIDGAAVPYYSIYNDQFEIIEKVEPAKLKVPPGYGPEIPEGDGVLVSKEIARDLYLVTDSSAWRNSLFKVNGDEIMVFGASGYPALAEKTIKLIGEQFPKNKITSVYVTHPHGYEIAGLKVYADKGIEILADEYSIAAIKAYPKFADDITKFKFRTIEHDQTIDGAHFYVLENMHAKRQSFVYFKDSEIIFQSKFLHIAFDNTIAKVIPSYSRTFIEFIRSKQLKFKRIVGNYQNNNISVEVLNQTYDAIM
ncbi:hypothetical protein RI844_12540 [Thalassotalea fonticola]|uniref:MBL fold metallo-hydrolase n=1 Tax=Thalassotalea fonticola TaxID=3065649 RepID=A0ABZ0GKA6_9GAMM|nr:hypothetical protein RI844_12540 [Colwelliaceae bacterium S1-1]